ncbi:hypothetical protein H5089_09640 [Pseudoalteromonas sp. SR45-1]|uniref:hypothetical protein n=1 Tax=Pseudoalteromonas sp. SR45-1 TaxID=2760932 RepID=UPI001602A2D4|nr:hypothetical protein [Pseudoalteromonas sp. SR45-1]MBB1325768.1 hypothetical protein [Pseudoalteromonas sp. SR45-1]
MKLLIICPDFYNYKNVMINEAEKIENIELVCFSERPSGFIYNLSRSFFPKLKAYLENKHLTNILKSTDHLSLDKVVIVRGELITSDFLSLLKVKHDGVRLINYQWDSISNNPKAKEVIAYYDSVLSFDNDDCKQYGLRYLPLFFSECSLNESAKNNKKVAFIGSYHGERLNRLIAAKEKLASLGYELEFKLYIPFLAYLKNILKLNIIPINYLFFKKMTNKEVNSFYMGFSFVLELPSEKQSGIPMRFFEAIAIGRNVLFNINRSKIDDLAPVIAQYAVTFDELESGTQFKCVQLSCIDEYHISNWFRKIIYS